MEEKMEERVKDLNLLLMLLTGWEEDSRKTPGEKIFRAWKGYLFETLNKLADEKLIIQFANTKSVTLTDAGMALRFTLTPRGFRPLLDSGAPDLTISATTRDYLALALREEDPDTLFFSRRLLMEGETDLGLLVKNTLDAVDWDSVSTRLAALKLPFAGQLFARTH